MSYTIYGLRIGGDTECRYVGMTSQQPQKRLDCLTGEARRFAKYRRGRELDPDAFPAWLLRHVGDIEAFSIARAETRADALETERAMVAIMLRLNHQLFNLHLVPGARRIRKRTYA